MKQRENAGVTALKGYRESLTSGDNGVADLEKKLSEAHDRVTFLNEQLALRHRMIGEVDQTLSALGIA